MSILSVLKKHSIRNVYVVAATKIKDGVGGKGCAHLKRERNDHLSLR